MWEVDYDWMLSRFVDKTFMQTPGIPSTRWFDATLLPKDQVAQPDTMKAMFIMGHGGNTIARMPMAAKGIETLDLLVVCDPYPTTWSVLSERKNGTYLLPACTSFEMDGSRTASNRSLQWGEHIVKPAFRSKNDYDTMYMLARKLGFADQMFKNIKVENGSVSAEDILREINRGGWSTGYCGQSPERLKAHMANQSKFDVVTLRAPKDDPDVGGDYGLPWPCWGTPDFKHPGTPVLYNTNLPVKEGGGTFRARFGVERDGVSLLSDGSYSQGSEIKDGYRVHPRRAEEARLGQGSHRAGNGSHPAGELRQPRRSVLGHRPLGRHPARRDRARLHSLWQRQGAHGRLEPTGSHSGAPRADLHAAARSRREVPDRPDAKQFRVPSKPASPCRRGWSTPRSSSSSRSFSARAAGRIRGRRRGDPLQQMVGRAQAGHVRRDQPE